MFTLWTKCSRGQKNRTKRDADDAKRVSITMNKGKGSSHTPLYGISRKFAETWRITCQNICRVRAESVLSTRKMWTRLWAPFPCGGVIIEEQFLGRRHFTQGDSSLPLYVPSYLCTYHQLESIGSRLIQMKIRIRNKPASKRAASSEKWAGLFLILVFIWINLVPIDSNWWYVQR